MPCTSDKDIKDSTTHLGFEAQLWLAADKLRNNVAPAEHKHVVLGPIFLKSLPHPLESQGARSIPSECNHPTQTGVCIVAKLGKRGNAVAVPLHTDLQARWESLAGKNTPEGYVIPSLAGLESGGEQGLNRQFQPLIPDAAVDRREVTHPAGRRFAKRSCHSLRHTFVSDQTDSRSNPENLGNLTGNSSAFVHDLYAHLERETFLATVHDIPSLPEL
jgi:hypothetical protein